MEQLQTEHKTVQHCEKRCGYDNDYVFIEGGNVMTSSVVMDTKMMCVEEDVSKYKGEKKGGQQQEFFHISCL